MPGCTAATPLFSRAHAREAGAVAQSSARPLAVDVPPTPSTTGTAIAVPTGAKTIVAAAKTIALLRMSRPFFNLAQDYYHFGGKQSMTFLQCAKSPCEYEDDGRTP